jgi:transcriptional regulator of acetoin/glycerol metabolism
VRELEFTIKQAAALCPGDLIQAKQIRLRQPTGTQPALSPMGMVPMAPSPAPAPPATAAPALSPGNGLESTRGRAARLSREDIVAALKQTGGNRNQAAKLLGVSRATFFRRLKEFRDG